MFARASVPSGSITRISNSNSNPTVQIAEGSNLKDVKGRIKSVTSIKKITKTMNMIATARLRAAQARMERARAFHAPLDTLFASLPAAQPTKNNLLVPITSDRGLCGAVNSSVVKNVRNIVKERESKGIHTSMACIGEKGSGQLGRDLGNKILWSAGETSRKPLNFLACSLLADKILSHEFDTATIVYNKFTTVISYTTTAREIPSFSYALANRDQFSEFEFEDDNTQTHLQDLAEYYLASALFQSYSDSAASELGGRMSSMDNATRNAGDMIKKLTIMYNRKRQAAITTELTEIISGAAAIE